MGAVALSVVIHYIIGRNTVTWLLVSVMLFVYVAAASAGNSKGVLENRVTQFFSDISMEIYLSHMVIFHVLEKLHLNTALGDGWMQYVFVVVMQRVIGFVERKMVRYVGVSDGTEAGNMGWRCEGNRLRIGGVGAFLPEHDGRDYEENESVGVLPLFGEVCED